MFVDVISHVCMLLFNSLTRAGHSPLTIMKENYRQQYKYRQYSVCCLPAAILWLAQIGIKANATYAMMDIVCSDACCIPEAILF